MTTFPRSAGRVLVAAAVPLVLLAAGCTSTGAGGPPSGGATSVASPAPSSAATSAASSTASSAASPTDTPSSPSATKTSRPTEDPGPPVDRCRTDQLKVTLAEADGGGAAGSVYYALRFTNTADDSCYLKGYSGVSFVGQGNGTQIGKAARRDRSQPERLVVLRSGARATEILRIAAAGAICEPEQADGLRVYPPEQTDAVFVKQSLYACPGLPRTLITVWPVGVRP